MFCDFCLRNSFQFDRKEGWKLHRVSVILICLNLIWNVFNISCLLIATSGICFSLTETKDESDIKWVVFCLILIWNVHNLLSLVIVASGMRFSLTERKDQWTEILSSEPRTSIYHNFLVSFRIYIRYSWSEN